MAKLSVKDLTLIPVLTALIVICSWVSIPFTVPFTMQTFAIFFSIFFAGGKKCTIAVFLYIAIGIAGMPVFSGFTGGIGHILSPTGGYIIGFFLSTIIMWLTECISVNETLRLFFAVSTLPICYTFGTAWFMLITKNSNPLPALTICVFPYIIPDCIKIFFAHTLSTRLAKIRKINSVN